MKKTTQPPSEEWEVVNVFDSHSCTLDFSVVEARNQSKHAIALRGAVNGKTTTFILTQTLSDSPINENRLKSKMQWRSVKIAVYAETILQMALIRPENSILGEASIQLLEEAAFNATKIAPQEEELRFNVKEGHLSNRKPLEDKKAEFIEKSVNRFKENLKHRLLYTGKKELSNMYFRLPETYGALHEYMEGIIDQIKSARASKTRQVREGWKNMVRSIPLPDVVRDDSQFPDDLLMRLDDENNWTDELHAKMQTHNGSSIASDIALEWACRLTSFYGYEPHSLHIRALRKILKREREKKENRGTDGLESVP